MGGTTRWSGPGGDAYAARFDALAATGADVHGEAALCASLVAPGARVLDAGCGTGRVAIRLAELGYDCVGVDVDAGMLAEARRRAPQLPWVQADLSALDLVGTKVAAPFDLVVLAGNVMPLVAAGTESVVVARVAAQLGPDGVLVAGFGLDRAHLPRGAGRLQLADYDAWCAAAGLMPECRLASWDGEPYGGGGYAVSIHRRAAPSR
jgi:SAM-dependent methyltransferase